MEEPPAPVAIEEHGRGARRSLPVALGAQGKVGRHKLILWRQRETPACGWCSVAVVRRLPRGKPIGIDRVDSVLGPKPRLHLPVIRRRSAAVGRGRRWLVHERRDDALRCEAAEEIPHGGRVKVLHEKVG